MEFIYHEKQDGSLCGLHCLNNLLQGHYYTAVDLAEIAQQMDQEEQTRMAESGIHTDDFRRFMEQPSSNMDDSGMFSVQVLTSALKIWDLNLVPYASSNPIAVAARNNPTEQAAYICNFGEHWLTVRRMGYQWFNLNSLLTSPELISDTFLSLFLTQLQHEGYSIFVVTGVLPVCKADEVLRMEPAVQTVKPKLLSEVKEDDDIRTALAVSLAKAESSSTSTSSKESKLAATKASSEEEELEAAIRLSLGTDSDGPVEKNEGDVKEPDLEDLRKKRLAFLEKRQ
ncbi:ataxin-3-like isoform X2 [Oratosquilla oratoria]|uniref:ataxin-3-like isoform X2 n=1 Tax=Oratosquilla oratoria TaxID=337810 RepID=UPI003F760780